MIIKRNNIMFLVNLFSFREKVIFFVIINNRDLLKNPIDPSISILVRMLLALFIYNFILLNFYNLYKL